MSWENEISNEFKKRNNPKLIGATVGKVLSVSPFKASILGGQIMLDAENSYVCSSLLERSIDALIKGTYNFQGTLSVDGNANGYSAVGNGNIRGDITLSSLLKVGDNVLVIPTANEQMFFIVDTLQGVS